jgi:uncharacterized protein (DUF2062 family)
MRKFLRKHLPSHSEVVKNPWLMPLGRWLHHHNLWHLHRRSAAGGAAVGLFCGLIPFPLQMIVAVLLAVVFRVNLPLAVITTLYSNPLTIVPLYALAYQFGAWISNARDGVNQNQFDIPEMNWQNWTEVLTFWWTTLGKPFLIGLPLLALIFAFVGYVAVRVAWRAALFMEWRARKRRQSI